jgi:hypothetical protein
VAAVDLVRGGGERVCVEVAAGRGQQGAQAVVGDAVAVVAEPAAERFLAKRLVPPAGFGHDDRGGGDDLAVQVRFLPVVSLRLFRFFPRRSGSGQRPGQRAGIGLREALGWGYLGSGGKDRRLRAGGDQARDGVPGGPRGGVVEPGQVLR